MTTNEEKIAEARKAAKAVYLATDGPVADDLARILNGLADALESQPAPLVVASRESLADAEAELLLWAKGERSWNNLVHEYRDEAEFAQRRNEADAAEIAAQTARVQALRLLASGVVSLAADRDRVLAERAWDEGHRAGWVARGPHATGEVVNPYRAESEGE